MRSGRGAIHREMDLDAEKALSGDDCHLAIPAEWIDLNHHVHFTCVVKETTERDRTDHFKSRR